MMISTLLYNTGSFLAVCWYVLACLGCAPALSCSSSGCGSHSTPAHGPTTCSVPHFYSSSVTASPTVVIDGYTHDSTFTSGDSVPLGTHIILVCHAVGLPYGTLLSYTWTCTNEPCEVEGYYGRKVYNEHILAVNTTSTRDGGTYTCQVMATGGQEATGSFSLIVTSKYCIVSLICDNCIIHCSLNYIQVVVLSTAMGDSFLMSSP